MKGSKDFVNEFFVVGGLFKLEKIGLDLGQEPCGLFQEKIGVLAEVHDGVSTRVKFWLKRRPVSVARSLRGRFVDRPRTKSLRFCRTSDR
jgi:hypothetical protein